MVMRLMIMLLYRCDASLLMMGDGNNDVGCREGGEEEGDKIVEDRQNSDTTNSTVERALTCAS